MGGEDTLEHLVQRWTDGDRDAFDDLVEVLYDDLRAMAHRHLQGERANHTLTTTALVHEAYVELSRRTGPAWRGRAQFFALLSKVMRHVLVDYARHRKAAKRGGGELHVEIDEQAAGATNGLLEILSVNRALEHLEARDARLARIVECRFFGGMQESEIAEALGVSTRTVERDWTRARAYLHALLAGEPAVAPEEEHDAE
ncbi:MAG: sigma-70 family RNA polymerase sigma factor [Vicinamibacterales bacterium]